MINVDKYFQVRVLQNVVQRNALKLLLSREDQKVTLQGWLTKVKHGHSKKVWCVLIGKMFIYFKTPNDQVITKISTTFTVLSKKFFLISFVFVFLPESCRSDKHARLPRGGG